MQTNIATQASSNDNRRVWLWAFLVVLVLSQLYFVRELLAAFAIFAIGFAVIAFLVVTLYMLQKSCELAVARLASSPPTRYDHRQCEQPGHRRQHGHCHPRRSESGLAMPATLKRFRPIEHYIRCTSPPLQECIAGLGSWDRARGIRSSRNC